MKRTPYQPTPRAQVELQHQGDRWTLVFVRELGHPPERVWRSLTDPAELHAWAPWDTDRNLGQLGEATLTVAGGPTPEVSRAEVRRADFPRLLEYTWDQDILRWELEPTAAGTRLTLRHTVADKSWIPKVAAGWHICLDVAAHSMAGAPIGRIVAEAALDHGWARLNQEYAAQLGIVEAEADPSP